MPPNQARDIWVVLLIIQDATIKDLVEVTGWNRHVVELTIDLLIEKRMVQRINVDTAEPRYEVTQRSSREVGPTSS
jgi:hypothetical protein